MDMTSHSTVVDDGRSGAIYQNPSSATLLPKTSVLWWPFCTTKFTSQWASLNFFEYQGCIVTVLTQHSNDSSVALKQFSGAHWEVSSEVSRTAFRYFRIRWKSQCDDGSYQLRCRGIELYGKMHLSAGNCWAQALKSLEPLSHFFYFIISMTISFTFMFTIKKGTANWSFGKPIFHSMGHW